MKKFLSGLLTAPIDHLRYQDGALVQTALRSVKLLGVTGVSLCRLEQLPTGSSWNWDSLLG